MRKDHKLPRLLDELYNPAVLPDHFEVVLEGERQVLGELIFRHDAYYEIDELLKSHFFYQEEHQIIYDAIVAMHQKAIKVDLKSTVHFLRNTGFLDKAGGVTYVTNVATRAVGNINKYVHGVSRQEYLRRRLIQICSRALNKSQDPSNDVFEIVDSIEDNTHKLHQELETSSGSNLQTEVVELVNALEKNMAHEDEFTGIPSGFERLDRLTQGFQQNDLIVIAARPGMGKTALVVSMMMNAAVRFQHPVLLFSLEMSSRQIIQRMISNLGRIDMDHWKKRSKDFSSSVERQKFMQDVSRLGSVISDSETIFIDDTPSISVTELKNRAKRHVREKGVKMIVVDYLQLMKSSGEGTKNDNREQVISEISRSLKALAKELEVPVIALSQLSRAVENRGGDKKPILSDLRESGSIEQDADIVLFIYRPEYYGITMDEAGNSMVGIAELIVAKHRNGSLEEVRTHYTGKYVKFED